jgi:L-aspartate oxidase
MRLLMKSSNHQRPSGHKRFCGVDELMQRYLYGGSFSDLPREDCDVLIVGAGLAGLYTALQLDPSLNIVILNKFGLDQSNSMYAQAALLRL